jgi:hypothetical protein
MNTLRLHASAENLSKDYLSPCKCLSFFYPSFYSMKKDVARLSISHLMSIIINSPYPSFIILIDNKQMKKNNARLSDLIESFDCDYSNRRRCRIIQLEDINKRFVKKICLMF